MRKTPQCSADHTEQFTEAHLYSNHSLFHLVSQEQLPDIHPEFPLPHENRVHLARQQNDHHLYLHIKQG